MDKQQVDVFVPSQSVIPAGNNPNVGMLGQTGEADVCGFIDNGGCSDPSGNGYRRAIDR